jgi:hypothetical protein
MNSIFAPFYFLRALRAAVFAVGFVVAGICVISTAMYKEVNTELMYYHRFGADWKTHYEERHGAGSLSEAHTKLMVGGVALPVIGALIWLIGRQFSGPGSSSGRRSSRRRRRRSHERTQEYS